MARMKAYKMRLQDILDDLTMEEFALIKSVLKEYSAINVNAKRLLKRIEEVDQYPFSVEDLATAHTLLNHYKTVNGKIVALKNKLNKEE